MGCWSWNSNTLATWCEELTYLKRPWCWERLRAGREGDNRGWDGWMASPTRRTWVWVDSGSWWWTGRPGVLWFMGSQRVGHDWATELNWICQFCPKPLCLCQTLCDPMDFSPPGSSVHAVSSGKDTGVGCHLLLLGIFLTQGSHPCLLILPHWQAGSLPLEIPGKYISIISP